MPSRFSRKSLNKLSLKSALAISFITLTVLSVGLVGYISYQNGQKAVNDVAYRLRSEISNRIDAHLSTFIENPQQINQLNTAAILQGLLDVNDSKAVERHFWHQVQIYKSVTSIYFGNTRGGLVNSGREGATGSQYIIATEDFKSGPFKKFATDKLGNRTELLVTVQNFDARTRQWYTGAEEKGADYWSPIYILFTGQDLAVASSRPVYDDQKKLLGVVSVDLFLSHISHFLKGITIGKNGHAFIIERSGLLIASSTDEKPFTEPDGNKQQRRLNATESINPVIRYAAESMIQNFGDYHRIKNEQDFEFEIDNKRYFLRVSPVRNESGPNWLIAVVVPEADFMAQINVNNRMTTFFIVITLLIAISISIFVSKRIVKPINLLNDAALNLANGKWKKEIHNDSRFVEISMLTRSFNQMAGQLQQMLNNLNHEIDDRKLAEEALRESEERHRLLADNVIDNIWVLQLSDLRMLYTSPSVEKLLGYTPKEIKEMEPSNYLTPESLKTISITISEELGKENNDAIDPNRSLTMQIEQIKKDGSKIWTEIIANFLRDVNGHADRILGITRDITDRKRAEKALADERNKLEIVTQNVGVGLAVISKDYRTVWANKVVKDIFGDVNDKLCHLTYNKQEKICPGCGVREVFTKGKELVTHEQKGKDANGNTIWSQIIATPIKDEDGNIISALEVIVPVTERKQLEEQLHQAHKMESIGTLTGGIAHDFNNILGIIIGNAEIVLDNVPEWNPAHFNLEEIKTAGLRAAGIVNQLLSFSRKTDQELKPSKISPVITDVLNLLRSTIPTTIEIRKNILTTEETIFADPIQINQVMMNLCINASHSMEKTGGILEISVEKVDLGEESINTYPGLTKGKYVKVSVSDTGPGISPEIIDRVFDPYFTTKEVGKGSGMGLAVVHGIVKNHNGAITIDTQTGRGTTFNILFPVVKDKLAIEIETTNEVPFGNETILFVDDEESIVVMIKQILERLGYNVETKTTPSKAIELFQSKPDHFDLVITDMTMPQMTGVQLSKKLIEIRSDIPVIICSGYSSLIDEEKAKELGVAAYVMKPIVKQEIAKTIRKVLDN